jgi:predicted DCC family thiol-disulfide oxidoreductase YuxK
MVDAGLAADDGRHRAWLITPQGQVYGGAEAINVVLRPIWWLRPLTYLYYLPGLRQLQDAVYCWVARNRGRLPGITPGCEAEFDCNE